MSARQVEAGMVIAADPAAATLDAALAEIGFRVNPLARGHTMGHGLVSVILVWRNRRARQSMTLNMTVRLPQRA